MLGAPTIGGGAGGGGQPGVGVGEAEGGDIDMKQCGMHF
jgi:hypothetical protein